MGQEVGLPADPQAGAGLQPREAPLHRQRLQGVGAHGPAPGARRPLQAADEPGALGLPQGGLPRRRDPHLAALLQGALGERIEQPQGGDAIVLQLDPHRLSLPGGEDVEDAAAPRPFPW